MTNVIKKGGKTQKFSPSKVKKAVMAALKDAKVPKPKRAKIVREVANPVIKACKKKKTVKVSVIRNLLVKKLRSKCKEGAVAWLKYEKRHRRKTRKSVKKRVVHRKRRR